MLFLLAETEAGKAAETVGQAAGLPAGVASAGLILFGMIAQPVIRNIAFLVPHIRGMFAPQGYEDLRKEVEAMAATLKDLADAVRTDRLSAEALHRRVTRLEDRNAAEDREIEIERRVRERMSLRDSGVEFGPGETGSG